MTVLFRQLRLFGYVSVLILAGGVLGITSYFASQFLPHTRFSYTVYSLVAPSVTVALLFMLLWTGSQPWIDALSLLVMAISWLGNLGGMDKRHQRADGLLLAWIVQDTDEAWHYFIKSILLSGQDRRRRFMVHFYPPSVPSSLSPLRPTDEKHITFFLIFVITLANRSQVLGWPDIWSEDTIDLPWFGEYPGYPGGPLYTLSPQLENQAPPVQGAQMVINGSLVQQQPGHSIVIWPGVNGEGPRIEQRPGIVTHSTLTL